MKQIMSQLETLFYRSSLEDVREDQRGVPRVCDPQAPGRHDEIQQQQAPQQQEGGEEVFSCTLRARVNQEPLCQSQFILFQTVR